MYVILVNDDNTLYGSHKERIMQGSKLVDTLCFVVPQFYKKTHDMTNALVMMEYLLPISRRYETEYLELCDERYAEKVLQYKLPFDTKLTNEHGSIQLQLTFAWVEKDANGKIIQRVRKTSPTIIEVIPISAWSDIIPDSSLASLDQRIIMQSAQIKALEDLANTFNSNQVDNLVYNSTEETLQLSSKGVGVGDKVSVRDMMDDGIPVVDLNSNDNSNSGSGNNCDCDCDCENNVVEFDELIKYRRQ